MAWFAVLAAAVSSTCFAQVLTVAWDPNTESDLAGYIVTVRDADGFERRTDVGLRTRWTASGLVAGAAYCFTVQAYNTSGLTSWPSSPACGTVGGPAAPRNETYADWLTRYGLSAAAADTDADGVTDAAEFALGTHPLIPNRAYLTEGATGAFTERLAVVNPDSVPAEVALRFLLDSGVVRTESVWVPPLSRETLDVNSLLGHQPVSASVEMTAVRGGAVLERTMSWSGNESHLAAHTAKSAPSPRREWYLAEGSARWFDTWVLVANPNAKAATLSIDFVLEDGTVVPRSYTLEATSRFSLLANAVPGVGGASFAARLRSDAEVTVERAMYFDTAGAMWRGGHVSPGIAAPNRSWFVAEGRTGPFFDTWLLIGNPGTKAATVTLRYMTPDGEALKEVRDVDPARRVTIHVDSLPGLTDTDVSVAVDSTQPIVVERSMYWPGSFGSWQEGHSSTGLTRLGRVWALAEGEWGGSRAAETYVLVANPGQAQADVTLRALREDGRPPLEIRRSVASGSRLTVSAAEFGLDSGERCGFLVESSAPIAVERSVYWSTPTRFWSAGTNETGTLLR